MADDDLLVRDEQAQRTSVMLTVVVVVTLAHIAVLWFMLQRAAVPKLEVEGGARPLQLVFIRESKQTQANLSGTSDSETSERQSEPATKTERARALSLNGPLRPLDSAPRRSLPGDTPLAPSSSDEALEPRISAPSGAGAQSPASPERIPGVRPLILDYQPPPRLTHKSAVEMAREQLNPDPPRDPFAESFKKAVVPKCTEGEAGLLNLPMAIYRYNNGKCKM